MREAKIGSWEQCRQKVIHLVGVARAVGRMTKSPEAEIYVKENAEDTPKAFPRQIETFLSEDESQQCVFLIDQFEELFTQTKEEFNKIC